MGIRRKIAQLFYTVKFCECVYKEKSHIFSTKFGECVYTKKYIKYTK